MAARLVSAMSSLRVRLLLILLSILATTLSCRCSAAPWPVNDAESHEHRANTSHYILLADRGHGGYVKQHQTRKLLSNKQSCSRGDVVLYQNNAPRLSSGIPAYSVEIVNSCTGCTVYNVHVSCRDFASTDLVNPALFRRLGFDDCLVKDGGAIGPGETVSFQYSNSFAYRLDVAYVACSP